jgi:hypothetical protein
VQNSFSAKGSSIQNSCFRKVAQVNTYDYQIGWCGQTIELQNGNATLDVPVSGLETISASVEYPLGSTRTQLTFDGAPTFTITPGVSGQSDDVSLLAVIPAGAAYRVHYCISSSGQWATWHKATGSGFDEGCSVGGADQTMTLSGPAQNGNNGWEPDWSLGFGDSQTPVVLIIGDSIGHGFEDRYHGDGSGGITCLGPFGRAFRSSWVDNVGKSSGYAVSTIDWGGGGRTLANIFSSTNPPELNYFPAYCTDLYLEMGRNDVTFGESASEIESYLTTLVLAYSQHGVSVHLCTITPYSTSTNQFFDLAGQTPVGNWQVAEQVNAWIRSNSLGCDVTDLASVCEYGKTGTWNSPGEAVYSGIATTGGSSNTLVDSKANFTLSDEYLGIRFTSGANANEPQAEVSAIDSTHQITWSTGEANKVAAGDHYELYRCAVNPDGEHPFSQMYSQMARYIVGFKLTQDK